MKGLYLLYENAQGYALLEVQALDEIGTSADAVQRSVTDLARFSKAVSVKGFKGYGKAAVALDQINSISESLLTPELQTFIETNLPAVKHGKKASWQLGVADAKLGSAIQEATGAPCVCNELTGELLRGVRLHELRLLRQLLSSVGGSVEENLHKSQLSLAHSYSRSKVKFNVNRVDNMIIQAIALLDTLDKDVNTFVMRVREWYSWHFPELIKLAADNYQYARLALAIRDKSTLTNDSLPALAEIVGDEEKAQEILNAAKSSMGQDISPIDLVNIEAFARKVINLAEYRVQLAAYLQDKMHDVAPNLSALIGEIVGARLISHAGSLVNLAKYPASTVQILGAEKALFRALKTRGNTPKYGLIFHSSFIGRAKQKDKGRISRYLANKCSIASRIDCFSDVSTSLFGEKLKEQVEERLLFYEQGAAPRKNSEAMKCLPPFIVGLKGGGSRAQDVIKKLRSEGLDAEGEGAPASEGKKKKKSKDKKRPAEELPENVTEEAEEAPKKKKKKKECAEAAVGAEVPDDAGLKKKKKKQAAEVAMDLDTEGPTEKKKKKKKDKK